MTDDDKKQVSAEVHRELYEKIKRRGHGEISKTIREAFRERADESAKYELEEVQEELADVEKELTGVEADITSIMERLTERVDRHSQLAKRKKELEERIETLETEVEHMKIEKEEKRKEALDSLTEVLRDGQNLFPGHGEVEEVAKRLGTEPEEIIEKMKERHPDVPEHAFEIGVDADTVWRGIDEGKFSSVDSDDGDRYPSLRRHEEDE